VTVPYQSRAAEHGGRRDVELKRSLQISRARLLVFLIAAASVIWTIAHRGGTAWIALDVLLVLVFAALVVVGVMGVGMYQAFVIIERRMTFWAIRTQEVVT